jgi:hypothetical protein
VAHIKRADTVTIKTTGGDAVRADRSTGADRLLRFLALVDSITMSELADKAAALASASTAPTTAPSSPDPKALNVAVAQANGRSHLEVVKKSDSATEGGSAE